MFDLVSTDKKTIPHPRRFQTGKESGPLRIPMPKNAQV